MPVHVDALAVARHATVQLLTLPLSACRAAARAVERGAWAHPSARRILQSALVAGYLVYAHSVVPDDKVEAYIWTAVLAACGPDARVFCDEIAALYPARILNPHALTWLRYTH